MTTKPDIKITETKSGYECQVGEEYLRFVHLSNPDDAKLVEAIRDLLKDLEATKPKMP